MKSTLLAVFGHYDSRGGTIAIKMEAPTEEACDKAKASYNAMYGWEPETDTAHNAGVGRICDQLVDQMMRGGQSPAECDYMYVAELHSLDEDAVEGDLAHGFNEEGWDVLIDLKEEGGRTPRPHHDTLTQPVQLELVKIPKNFFKDLDDLEDWSITNYNDRMLDIKEGRVTFETWSPREKHEEWARQERREWEHRVEGMRWERLKKLAQVIKQPAQTRWDDDACGFYIGE